MISQVTRRSFVFGTAGVLGTASLNDARAQGSDETLVTANSTGRTVAFVDLSTGDLELLDVGHAPWGITSPDGSVAFVSTAEGVTRVDLEAHQVDGKFPFSTAIPTLSVGEYRPGGMGIAVDPNGEFVHVAVYRTDGPSVVETLRADTGTVEAVVEVGVRPFQVLLSPDGRRAYSIDHDSFTVTVIDVESGSTIVIPADPLGAAGFDKPHYAALDTNGNLVMPYQGVLTIRLDPSNGEYEAIESAANTHQHGIARIGDSDRYVIVGTGPAGRATGGPNISILDMDSGDEMIWPLARPHEDVVVSADLRYAYLTGGYSFQNQGWDGVTRLDLKSGEIVEFGIPDKPLGALLVHTMS